MTIVRHFNRVSEVGTRRIGMWFPTTRVYHCSERVPGVVEGRGRGPAGLWWVTGGGSWRLAQLRSLFAGRRRDLDADVFVENSPPFSRSLPYQSQHRLQLVCLQPFVVRISADRTVRHGRQGHVLCRGHHPDLSELVPQHLRHRDVKVPNTLLRY